MDVVDVKVLMVETSEKESSFIFLPTIADVNIAELAVTVASSTVKVRLIVDDVVGAVVRIV